MRGETSWILLAGGGAGISIHSPHAGRDRFDKCICIYPFFISIHSPHAGRDATRHARYMLRITYFNPLSPCGERPKMVAQILRVYDFNPLSPCGERLIYSILLDFSFIFQSTLPMRGETSKTMSSCCS